MNTNDKIIAKLSRLKYVLDCNEFIDGHDSTYYIFEVCSIYSFINDLMTMDNIVVSEMVEYKRKPGVGWVEIYVIDDLKNIEI